MSLNINSQYNTSSYATTGKSKSVSDYSKYLSNKYPCLTPGKSVSISIAPSLLRKAMGNEKTAKWLEENLAMEADLMQKQQNMCKARGERIVFQTTEYVDEGVMTSSIMTVTDSEPNTEIDEWLEKIKEKKEEQKKAEKSQEDIRTVTVQGSDVNEVIKAMKKELSETSVSLEQEVLQNSFDVKA